MLNFYLNIHVESYSFYNLMQSVDLNPQSEDFTGSEESVPSSKLESPIPKLCTHATIKFA